MTESKEIDLICQLKVLSGKKVNIPTWCLN